MQSLKPAWCRLIAGWSFLNRLSASVGRGGAVALITAAAASMLVTIVGFACDYGYASYINQRLARATDSGTLGSVSQTAATTAGGYTQTAAMQAIGVNIFKANVADLPATGIKFDLSVVSDGAGGVVATGSYTYNVPTFFGGLLGLTNIPVSGTAKTIARPTVYVNYYILVDNSQSMGIGTTQADMTALYQRVLKYANATGPTGNPSNPGDGGCVFGCHIKQKMYNAYNQYVDQPYTNEDLAHNLTQYFGPPIALRIDSAVQAVSSIVNSAAQVAATTKNIQFGLYTIGLDATTNLRIVPVKYPQPLPGTQPDFSPSSDYTSVQKATALIGLGNTISTMNRGDTDFTNEFSDFLAAFKAPNALVQGSGASATSPINYVFIVTDGLSDTVGSCQPFYVCTAPISANECDKLKTVANVGVIYTTYLPIYQFNTSPNSEFRYKNLVETKAAAIPTNLQACATSSDLYFEATDGPTIVSSMQTLFQRTQPTSARITQ